MSIRGFFTQGILGMRYGKKGFFSKPNTIELNWSLGDKTKKDSDQKIEGKAEGDKFKCDLKIKL